MRSSDLKELGSNSSEIMRYAAPKLLQISCNSRGKTLFSAAFCSPGCFRIDPLVRATPLRMVRYP